MKNNKRSNQFDREELARWYDDHQRCAYCGMYGANSFHHTLGRTSPHSNSIFNATPLHNQSCHIEIHGEISKREQAEEFIEENIYFLMSQGYEPNGNDIDFIIYNELEEVLERVNNKI